MARTLGFVPRYTRVPGSLEMRLVETNPYIRLRSGNEPPIFLQGGVAYDEGGVVVAQWPEWLQQAGAALDPAPRAGAWAGVGGRAGCNGRSRRGPRPRARRPALRFRRTPRGRRSRPRACPHS